MEQHAYKNWKLEIDHEQILWLTIDRAGAAVNSLNRELLEELDHFLDNLDQAAVKAIILRSGKTSGFVAGADIEQFVHLSTEEEAFALVRQAQIIFDKLAALKIPTVAMIEGFCLGGGLELVLACRYRVAEESQKTQIGAPEVKLGLQPGWGGTVRLPRLVGVLPAMDINLSGRSLNAKAAAKIGLVDVAVPKRQLWRAACYYALHRPPKHQPSWLQKTLETPFLRPLVAKMLYKKLQQKVSRAHYPAPFAIVDNWEKNGCWGKDAMLDEAVSISKLMMTETSRNLVRVFFLQTRMKGLAKDIRFPAQHVHVVGAGTMGGDIAAWCALRGLTVTLQDRLPELIAPAMKRAHELFQKKLKIPRLVQAAMDRLIADPQGLGVVKADVVIEAVSENLAIKQVLYQTIEPQLKPHAILATNTSSLPLEELSRVLKKPERLVGLHFFNPVAMMQLVEVVHAPNTDAEVIAQSLAFVRTLDRLPLPVKSKPGFLVNRVSMPYLMEAMILFEEGVAPEVIDEIAVSFGMPMGPIELADTVGLDVCLAVAEILAKYFGSTVPARLKDMVSAGNLGRKTGQGFYAYKKGKCVRPVINAPHDKANDILDRLVLSMVNEAVTCLQEEIAPDADLIDAGMIFGTGFAPFRGGPLHYAQSRGVVEIVARLKELQQLYGQRFEPSAGWELL